jgi:predicted phage-related endonuclease
MIASCDRFIPSKVDPGNGILEIKTTNPWTFKKVKLTGLPHTWILQLQHYLEVWDFAWGSYAVLDRESGEMLTFDVERDEDLGREIVDHIGQWWDRHIIDREPVEVETPKPVKLPEVGGELVKMGSPEWADAVAALREAKEIAAQAKQLEDAAKERVVALMGEADVAEGAGLRVYYREQAGRKTFDKKALQAAHPEIDLSQYEKQGKPFRSLRTYDVGEVE